MLNKSKITLLLTVSLISVLFQSNTVAQARARIDILSYPSHAEIIVDGKATGKFTPSRINFEGESALVRLKIRGYEIYEERINLKDKKEFYRHVVKLKPKKRVLIHLVSDPPNAEIIIDGKATEKFTTSGILFYEESVRIKLKLKGYEIYEESTSFKDQKNHYRHVVKLIKKGGTKSPQKSPKTTREVTLNSLDLVELALSFKHIVISFTQSPLA